MLVDFDLDHFLALEQTSSSRKSNLLKPSSF